MYFQEGAVNTGLDEDKLRHVGSGRVLARFSQNGDGAASVTRHGKGWVGRVGPYPKSNDEWCEYCPILTPFPKSLLLVLTRWLDWAESFTNPDDINFDMGYDFIVATLNGGKIEEA